MLSLAGFTPSDRVLGIEEITDEGGEPSLTWFAFRCSMKPCRGSQIGSIAARPVSPGLGLAGGHQTIPLLLPSFKSTTLSSPSGPRASSQTDDLLCPLEISQNPPYHVPADAWASSLQIRQPRHNTQGFAGSPEGKAFCLLGTGPGGQMAKRGCKTSR